MADREMRNAAQSAVKFAVHPAINPAEPLYPGEVEELIGRSQAQLAYMRRRGHGPEWQRFGRHIGYRIGDVIDWLNAVPVAEMEADHDS